jgi:hypothetical protein
MTTDLRKELRQLVMESYDKGVADAMKAATAAAQAAVAAEREACAKVCDAAAKKMDDEGVGPTGYRRGASYETSRFPARFRQRTGTAAAVAVV